MNLISWINHVSMTGLFIFTLLYVYAAIMIGMEIGTRIKQHSGAADSSASVVGATLGLLAFILAFTFNMAANRFDARKQLYVKELDAISTTYLRAGLLPQSYKTRVRAALRDYVDLRVRLVEDPNSVNDVIARSEKIQDQLWSDVEKLVASQRFSTVQNQYIQSLNEMINLQRQRVNVGFYFRIPDSIWATLYGIAALALIMVGYQFGRSRQRQIFVNLVLGLAFASVILVIADLDRAVEGTVKLDTKPLYSLQNKLQQQTLP